MLRAPNYELTLIAKALMALQVQLKANIGTVDRVADQLAQMVISRCSRFIQSAVQSF